MTKGLRPNAHQLVEAATLGYGIGNDASPMTVVDTAAWEGAGGHVVGTTTTLLTGEDPAIDRNLDDGGLTSVGELALGERRPDPDRRRRAADADRGPRTTATGCATTRLTYSGLFLMENSIRHDVAKLGVTPKKKKAKPRKKGAEEGSRAGRGRGARAG